MQLENLQSVYPLLKRDVPRYYDVVWTPIRAKAVIHYNSNVYDKMGLNMHGISPDKRVTRVSQVLSCKVD